MAAASLFQVLTSLAATSALASAAMAGGEEVFTIDSTNGTINGLSSGVINGVSYTFLGNIEGNTIAQFRIDGDLNLLDDQVLDGFGSRCSSPTMCTWLPRRRS